MKAADILAQLEAVGTEQARKIYRRHGADANVYGVSYVDFKKFKKTLKTNQPLAEEIWKSGNHDARVLATMIADPQTISQKTLDSWMGSVTNYVLADAMAGLASQTPMATTVMDHWISSDLEWTGGAGWSVLSHLLANGEKFSATALKKRLKTIEAGIHMSANRVRHCMNGALIAIGISNEELRPTVIETARRIGKVIVDHGETSCKTPDAIQYIERALARKA